MLFFVPAVEPKFPPIYAAKTFQNTKYAVELTPELCNAGTVIRRVGICCIYNECSLK